MDLSFIALAIVQAVTEFLPISSSGHLILLEKLFELNGPGLEALLHLPTALVILFYYRKELIALLQKPKQWPIVLIAMIPAGIVGLLLGDVIDLVFYSPLIIGINQVIWGIVFLWIAMQPKIFERKDTHDTSKITISTAIKIGFAQLFALIPGTSRSGIATLAGISEGLSPRDSAQFSFIIGFPLILAASLVGFYKFFKATSLAATGISLGGFALGMLLCFGIGLLAVWLLNSKYIKHIYKYSGLYRIIIGIFILLWLL